MGLKYLTRYKKKILFRKLTNIERKRRGGGLKSLPLFFIIKTRNNSTTCVYLFGYMSSQVANRVSDFKTVYHSLVWPPPEKTSNMCTMIG